MNENMEPVHEIDFEKCREINNIIDNIIEDGKNSIEVKKTHPWDEADVVINGEDAFAIDENTGKAKKPFKFNYPWVFLTYKTHIDKDKLHNFIAGTTKHKIEFIRSAHESADKQQPYEHTHTLVKWVARVQVENCRKWDWLCDDGVTIIHPHVKIISGRTHYNNQMKYLSKEDPANIDLQKICIASQVMACETLQEAFEKYVDKPSDAMGIKLLFDNKSVENDDYEIKLDQPWQFNAKEMALMKPVYRIIIWFYDARGGAGKTTLAKWLMKNENWLVTKDMGTNRDAATIIGSAKEAGWKNGNSFTDLPRSAENHKSLYEWLESLLDGLVTTQKYKGKSQDWKPGHIWVGANWLPDVDRLSLDRWVFYNVESRKLVPMSLDQVRKIKEEKATNSLKLKIL